MDITPDNQNIDKLFSSTTYHIDFYQRDYKWSEEPVKRLLDDIFYKFNQEYQSNKDLDPTAQTVTEKYSWYYLNTYVTNTVGGKVYIVDGQQRLTTITLILIKLFHIADSYESKTDKWLENKIAGFSGMEHSFWMNHETHNSILEDLYKMEKEFKEMDVSSGITAENILSNYIEIDGWLSKELTDKHKFETFVFYFLQRLVLIKLSVEQTDVPMVFEVINDRGVRLKPYEILKGKLLGQIDKVELDQKDYNGLWEDRVKSLNHLKKDETDTFFRFYLKAKFADSRKEGQRFDGEYHREMFSNHMAELLKLKHNPPGVKKFLENEFSYFSKLYSKIYVKSENLSEGYEHLYYNNLNDLDGQFLLILSACKLNDYQEDEKIKEVSYQTDRFFALLQLQNSYDSNSFNDAIYKISSEIREASLQEIKPVFDKYLLSELSERRNSEASEVFQYGFFRNTGINLNKRFKRYFFGRIDNFLSDNLNVGVVHEIGDLVKRTGHKTGFHIEHILSHNDENLKLFKSDEDLFEQERNRLGGILLLKGRDNISSSNESYSEKLKSYADTLLWNRTLREDAYKSKIDVKEFKDNYDLELEPMNQFGPEELEKRHRLLYELSKLIWE